MKTKSLALTSSLFLGLFFGPPDAHAATVILPVMADTFIISSAPDNNAGGNTLLNLGTDGQGGVRRGLLRFDLSAIPAGATVTSAVLRLTVVRIPFGGPMNSNFKLYRLLADWSGGTQAGNSGAPAAEGEVTWNSRLHGTGGWTVPGAASDAESTASASQFVNSISGVTYEWAGAGVARDVQDWMNEPGSNFGWLLRSDNEESRRTARAFAALESGNNSGTLEISYTVRTNLPPTVAITNPTNGAVFTTGAIVIEASAMDTDSGVAMVQFFDGTTLIGSDTSAPYRIPAVLTNVNHTFTAVAVDREGASATSSPVVVRYNPYPAPVLQIIRSNQSLIIHWDGPYILESTPVLNHPGTSIWTIVPGTPPVTLPIITASNRYFRAVHP